MSEQEQQKTADRLSQDEWHDLQLRDRAAAEKAYQEGRVDIPAWLADELESSNDHFKLLEALDQSFQNVAEAAADQEPEPKQTLQLSGEEAPERPLPDKPVSWSEWKTTKQYDPDYGQRLWDAGLVDVPTHIREEIR